MNKQQKKKKKVNKTKTQQSGKICNRHNSTTHTHCCCSNRKTFERIPNALILVCPLFRGLQHVEFVASQLLPKKSVAMPKKSLKALFFNEKRFGIDERNPEMTHGPTKREIPTKIFSSRLIRVGLGFGGERKTFGERDTMKKKI
jgi:hypothetical protein